MDRRSDFSKNTIIKAAMFPSQSSLERKNFVKLKKTQLFYLVIIFMKLFAVPRACTR